MTQKQQRGSRDFLQGSDRRPHYANFSTRPSLQPADETVMSIDAEQAISPPNFVGRRHFVKRLLRRQAGRLHKLQRLTARLFARAASFVPEFPYSRLVYGGAAVAVLVAIVVPVGRDLYNKPRYTLDAKAKQLIGEPSDALVKKLTYDPQKQIYQFNKQAEETAATAASPQDPSAKMLRNMVGGQSDQQSQQLYSLDLSEDLSKGITVYDNNLSLQFRMYPQFGSLEGKQQDGHLVYPINNGQIVYTLKGNGLKEDVLLSQAPSSGQLTLSYRLDLPDQLEARLTGDGGIGIYSADAALYGNITYGTDADRDKVMQARLHSKKTNLVFEIPAPRIYQWGSNANQAAVHYELNNNVLSVVSTGLRGLSYPVTIDPSVVLTSSSDFKTGNNEGNVDYTTSGQIGRNAIKGAEVTGSFIATSGTTNFTNARTMHGSVIYNDKIYVLGGYNGTTDYNDVQYASLNTTTGAISGTWSTTTAFDTTGRYGINVVVYNGYMYVIGGMDHTGTYASTIRYGKIDPTAGTIASWSSISVPFRRALAGAVVYNDYLYVLEGLSCGTGGSACTSLDNAGTSRVVRAAIRADGTLGSFINESNVPSIDRYGAPAVVFNGYIYIVCGATLDNATYYGTLVYSRINSDGSVNKWITTTQAISAPRLEPGSVIANGYLYVMGGANTASSNTAVVSYTALGTDGSIGNWQSSINAMSGARHGGVAMSYNNYLYYDGGSTSGDTTYYQTELRQAFAVAGTTTAVFSNTSQRAMSAIRSGQAMVAYKGYIYEIGGYSGTGYLNSVEYARIDNSNTIYTWTTLTSNTLPAARAYAGVAVYNDYLYVIGGMNGSLAAGANIYYARLMTDHSGTIDTSGSYAVNTTTGWGSYSTQLPLNRTNLQAFAYAGRLYAVGGMNTSGTSQSTIYTIQLDKTSGAPASGATWTTTGTSLTARDSFGLALFNNYVYVVGGLTTGTRLTSIQYAPIHPDTGVIDTFAATTTQLASARSNMQVAIINGFLYVIGGYNGTAALGSIDYVELSASTGNTTGSFATSTNLLQSVYDEGLGVQNGHLYILGGTDGTTTYATAQVLEINNGGQGTADSFATGGNANGTGSTAGMPAGRTQASVVVTSGHMYVIGGNNSSAVAQSTVYVGTFDYDGSINSFTTTTNLPNTASSGAAATYNGYIYFLGGEYGAQDGTTQVLYAKPDPTTGLIPSSGTCAVSIQASCTWTVSAKPFPNKRINATAVTYNGYLYLIGGADSAGHNTYYNTVQKTALTATGELSGWSQTTAFSDGREFLAAVAYNGYLYVAGGDDASTPLNDVQYAPINASTGAVGTWNFTASLDSLRNQGSMFVYNGYMYFVGGTVNLFFASDDVLFAPVLANGGLGTWNFTNHMLAQRALTNAVFYNGFIYVPGGQNASGTILSTVDRAPLNSIPRTARYSTLIDLGTPSVINSLTYTGNLPNGNSGLSFLYAGADGVFSNTATLGGTSLGTAGQCTGIKARYALVTVSMDEQASYAMFPDDQVTTDSYIADMTLGYSTVFNHPAPNLRMRTGKTLQENVGLTPYDTCF